MKKIHLLYSLIGIPLLISGCNNGINDNSDSLDSTAQLTSSETSSIPTPEPSEYKRISKDEYYNKTLGGLLGQFAGFLSGYEFVWKGPDPYVGLPQDWYDFINGPYAGNFEHFWMEEKNNRLRDLDGTPSIWSDDDYHIDIFNQTIINEYGYTSEDIKNAWIKYKVHDWGGGYDANRIINIKDYSSPFTGTLEAGNRYSWCTEAYIENETLGMDAAGMPNTANLLTERFSSLTGYFEPVMWAKLFATMYSYAYLYNDVNVILEKARLIIPSNSWPDRIIDGAIEAYHKYPNDYIRAAEELYSKYYRNTHGIDNIQTNPGVNGAFTIYSFLYGQGDYEKAALASSMMGFDGDCTAAIVCGIYGIMNGFHPESNNYDKKINDKIYANGYGIYHNDTESGFDPYIGANYPENQRIIQIVDLYKKNFEKILQDQGGYIEGNDYVIPYQEINRASSYLFNNYDLENDNTDGFISSNNAYISVYEDGDNLYSHSGYRALRVGYQEGASGKVEAYHTYNNLVVGKTYRLSTFIRSDVNYYALYSSDDNNIQEANFKGYDHIRNNVLLFKATSQTMKVGVSFTGNSDSDFLVLDDFMLEQIEDNSFGNIINNEQPKKYLSSVSFKTSQAPINEEAILRVRYRCLYDFDVGVLRNNQQIFNVPFYACSLDNNSGENIVEIPFTFKNINDVVTLSFIGNSIYIYNIELVKIETYLFR